MKREGAPGSPGAGASRRALFGWVMFDWANQPYFTLITTFIYAPFFATVLVGDAVRGQTLWSHGQAAAGLLVALLAPVAGAIGDARGPRKPWIASSMLIAMAAMAGLWFAGPGATHSAVPILVLVVVAALGVEVAVVFNNAMLPDLAPRGGIGRLSGLGWGIGYIGGLVALLMVVFLFDRPWTGLDAAMAEPARFTGPFSALWLGVFAMPLFLFTPDAISKGTNWRRSVRRGLGNLLRTVGNVSHYRNITRFLIGRMIYHDGLTAIYAFGGIYAAGIFGWDTRTLGLFGIVLIVFSMIGAFAGGWLDDRIGSRRTVMIALCGLILGTLGIISISTSGILFVINIVPGPAGPGGALFATIPERAMIIFSALVGICGGPVQAASRTFLARIAPRRRTAELFGLYALSGKATAFAAPLLVGVFTAIFSSQRAGLAVVIPFLIVGLAIVASVREERSAPAS